MLLSLLLLLFFQLAKEFAIAILRFGLGAGGHTLRWGGSVPLRPLAAGSSASSSSMTEISLLDATEDDSISLAAGRCNRSRFCGTGARLNLAGRGAVLGGVFEVGPRQTTSLDLDEGGEDGCLGAAPFSMTARTTHLVAGTGSSSKPPPEEGMAAAAAAASLGRVSSSYTQLLQGALAALEAGDSFWTATVAARETGRRPSVVKGRETLPALPLFSSGDEATPSQSPLHIANLEANKGIVRKMEGKS